MIQLQNVSFAYGNGVPGVCDVNLHIQKGEMVLLCGVSGCGKTTLTRLINGLAPHFYEGDLSGTVTVDGICISEVPIYELAGKIGTVFQNPRSQFFHTDTTGELAFGCENIGLPVEKIRARIDRVGKELNLTALMDRNLFLLSGGEKQRIACGSVAALEPEVVILDEPSSNLDMRAIADLRKMIRFWKSQGKTIVAAEHRFFYLADLCDRVLWMKDGRIQSEWSGEAFARMTPEELAGFGLRTNRLSSLRGRTQTTACSNEMIALEQFQYTFKNGHVALDVPYAEFPLGSITALVGCNGAGKTTFSELLCGLKKQKRSAMTLKGRKYNTRQRLATCYMVMQDVNHQLFTECVLEEVLLSQNRENREEAVKLLRDLDLQQVQERHPMSLSGGQRQRTAICTALAADREIILYDEPTSGLDHLHMREVAACMMRLKELGKTQIVVTHDPEFLLLCCDYVLQLEQGMLKGGYALNEVGTERVLQYFCDFD